MILMSWIPAFAGMTTGVVAAELELISVKQGTHTMTPADSTRPSISDDGRFVAFESSARLLMEDRNKVKDVYVMDRTERRLTRIVTTEDALRRNAAAFVSGDGDTVAFHSYSPLKPRSDVPLSSDIGFYDMKTGDISWPIAARLGKKTEGESQFPRLNRNGRRVLFTSNSRDLADRAGFSQIYVFDRYRDDAPVLLSRVPAGAPANRPCGSPRLSDDGKHVAFLSAATNLEAGVPANNVAFHLYWHDRSLGTLTRVDLFEKGIDPAEWMVGAFDMDAEGDLIVFEARRRNLEDPYKTLSAVDLFMYDRERDCVTVLTSGVFAGKSRNPSLSGDGRFVAFVMRNGDGIVVHDREGGRWQLIAEGICDNAMISRDGRAVVFDRYDKTKTRNVYVVDNPLYGEP